MKAGILDRRINVRQKTEVIATNGQRTESWDSFLNVWSDPVQELGKESTTESNRKTDRMVKFRTRYNNTITNEMRIVWDSETYKIEDIKELGRKDGLMILCSKIIQT